MNKPSKTTIWKRMKKGMSREEAENTPPMSKASSARMADTPWRRKPVMTSGHKAPTVQSTEGEGV